MIRFKMILRTKINRFLVLSLIFFHRAGAFQPTLPPRGSDSFVSLKMWSGEDDLQGSDRIKSCVPYVLPLVDGDHFGNYIYERIPPLGVLDDILLQPLVGLFDTVPFLGLILFVALTLGTRGNTDMSRGVRFNAQQAALIDVALVFPELIASSFENEPDLPRYIAEPCSNFVYYAYISAVIYSIVSNLRGKKPNQIPYISEWSELAVGPF
mmetsp:Transcript_16589/g.30003  ORF Transcript_16589/g.30003 Transcript_16589/m.30003 type:complete len:210 (-) Transcript_16589:331-960(-)